MDHYYHNCRPSVRPSKSRKAKQISSEHSDPYLRNCGSSCGDHCMSVELLRVVITTKGGVAQWMKWAERTSEVMSILFNEAQCLRNSLMNRPCTGLLNDYYSYLISYFGILQAIATANTTLARLH